MDSDGLYDLFRSDTLDLRAPYLWSDDEVYEYMDEAYSLFIRSIGGVPDTTSALTTIQVVAGIETAEVSPLILKFKQAVLGSTGKFITPINYADMPVASASDYFNVRTLYDNRTAGPVEYMVIGNDRNRKRGIVRWVQIPQVNDTVQLNIMRAPLDTATQDSVCTFDDMPDDWNIRNLLLWMKARAYGKQDAETFNRGKRDDYEAKFNAVCEKARAEAERYKSKVRTVAYGGL